MIRSTMVWMCLLLGAAMVAAAESPELAEAAHAGIASATLENSAAYIQNWLQVLKDDRRAVIVAAGQAQKAADFILNQSAEDEPAH